ncbi:MAG: hypothetical protein NW241_22265 [Bacteroidia bacterium]|nr:hypothetical protein [Bacteroidia bacterium]
MQGKQPMEPTLITLRIDPAQREFFLKLVAMLGIAEVVPPAQLIRQYQQQAPADVPLSEEEIMQEIQAHRNPHA